jgi:SSS family solute:Na+ symporter
MAITILISLATRPHPETQLRGLVYGLTEVPHEQGVSWYHRPVPLAVIVAVALVFLNLLFR